MRYFIFILAIILSYSLLLAPASAQLGSTDNSASITLEPQHPRPGETVTATVSNLGSQLTGSPINWSLNGQTIGTANDRSVTFVAGSTDTPQIVRAAIGGTVLEQVIRPVYLDIIVEPQTRTPAFYRGRPAPSVGSRINVTALVNGTTRNPNNLIYYWRLNFDVIGGGPMRGRNAVAIDLPRFESNNILTVEVSEPGVGVIARRSFALSAVDPIALFYEYDPLLGLAERALINNQLILTGNSATVRVEPYHLDARVFNNPAIIEWRIANVLTPNAGSNPYEVTIQRRFGQTAVPVSFRMSDTTNFSQAARGNFNVQ